jgi:hypothetical protein
MDFDVRGTIATYAILALVVLAVLWLLSRFSRR